jgi:tRNA(Ile)-lysidine synthase
LSGGLDSVVLLDLLVTAAGRRGMRVSAVHVHHGLSANADAWADFCRELCRERGVPLDVERVRVDRGSPEGLEAAARAARYAVYASRPEAVIALAHHRDDQAETVLLQLLRGAGLKGVAGMPEMRALDESHARLWRPLLDTPRSALRAHAEARGLRWIEDESNAALRHDRNYVRHEIASRLDERLPRWREAVARFARHAAGADALLAELARLDGLPEAPGADLLVAAPLDDARRGNLLRAWLDLNGIAMPSEARLAEMTKQLFGARGDARVRVDHAGAALVRFRDRVRFEQLGPGHGAWHKPWHGELDIDLGDDRGAVRFESASGDGVAAARAREEGWHFAGRGGGERLRLHPKRPTRTLKNLLREADLPPWERERLPLLFHRERLVWAPGIGIEADYACPPGEPGLRPVWLRKGAKT